VQAVLKLFTMKLETKRSFGTPLTTY